jgi:flagella synthesis protein FlgN
MTQGGPLQPQPLRHVLEELLECSIRLQDTLIAERDALTQHNLNTLNAHTEAKKDLLVRLEALEVQRRAQLKQLGFDPNQDAIVPELSSLWQQVLEALRGCQEANEVNGAIVRTHQTQTQRALDLLAGRDSDQTLYEASGYQETRVPAARANSGEISKA